ncbi:MAG: PhzF family phenazine biosynthesis protein [Woeseiaceae bacterium]
MELTIYQIDAFASRVFTGNPAAICPLQEWLDDTTLQSIAAENNLSETAYFVATTNGFHIRWFTPTTEVDLCGHATLAAAHVIFNVLGYQQEMISFESKSGILTVAKDNELLVMNFPAQAPTACDLPNALLEAFTVKPIGCLKSEDYILVFNDEQDVINAEPKLELLTQVDCRGVIITAKSNQYDFTSRFFAPKYGINEDPVTGSAYTQLVPYWAAQLNKNTLHSKQVSARGGELFCELLDQRVSIAGYAVKYLQGTISVPEIRVR